MLFLSFLLVTRQKTILIKRMPIIFSRVYYYCKRDKFIIKFSIQVERKSIQRGFIFTLCNAVVISGTRVLPSQLVHTEQIPSSHFSYNKETDWIAKVPLQNAKGSWAKNTKTSCAVSNTSSAPAPLPRPRHPWIVTLQVRLRVTQTVPWPLGRMVGWQPVAICVVLVLTYESTRHHGGGCKTPKRRVQAAQERSKCPLILAAISAFR
jgi:hypothetical protein